MGFLTLNPGVVRSGREITIPKRITTIPVSIDSIFPPVAPDAVIAGTATCIGVPLPTPLKDDVCGVRETTSPSFPSALDAW